MLTLSLFLIALAIIVFSLLMKNIEIKRGRKIFLANLFLKSDQVILRIWGAIKRYWSKVNFQNLELIFTKIIGSIRHSITSLKRRFDHKHSPFFTQKDHDMSKNKGSVSFFLKDVSEYKKTLREGRE